jgi:hypothetical protein
MRAAGAEFAFGQDVLTMYQSGKYRVRQAQAMNKRDGEVFAVPLYCYSGS